MRKIRKVYNVKIVAIIVASLLLCNVTLYSYPASRDSLRVPIGDYTRIEKQQNENVVEEQALAEEDNTELDGDKVEKKLLDTFYSHISKDKLKAALIEGEVLAEDRKYKYLYFDFWRNTDISMEIGERFYRAGDIFVID
ncbi:MAG: hypothetical protein ACYSSI_09710, partial [Planctomycetota bacterium]